MVAGNSRERHLPFRPDLQGLRAIAILLVVLSHAGVPWFPGGFIGVDVFFVLSGYLITGLLIREFEQTGQIALLEFYARRLKRLLPALAFVILATVLVASWLLSPAEALGRLGSLPYASTWTSNLYFALRAIDYFDELAAGDLFIHTWSLGVEEQFYLVWPLVLLTFVLTKPFRQVSTNVTGRLILLSAITATSFSFSLYLLREWPISAFYQMPSRIWQFSLGAMVYVYFTPMRSISAVIPHHEAVHLDPIKSWVAQVAGFLLVVGSAVGFHSEMEYPGFWGLLPSLGAVLLIVAGCGSLSGDRRGLANRGLVWLGDRSYSWYLWHWPVLMLGFSMGLEGQWLPVLGLVLSSLVLASLTYRLIEVPFWKGSLSKAPLGTTVLAGCLAMTFLLAFSFHGVRYLESETVSSFSAIRWRHDRPEIYRMSCDAFARHANVEPCAFGNHEASKSVYLIGDSVGAQWFSMVPAIFQQPEWKSVVLTKSACAMVDFDYYYKAVGGVYHVCTEWRTAVLEMMKRERPDVIIIGSSAFYSFDESQWIDGSRRVIALLSDYAGTVLLIPGTPSLSFDGPGCIARNASRDGSVERSSCGSPDRSELPELVKSYLSEASESFPNVHILDLNDLVCPNGYCAATDENGSVVFRDSMHLTDSFVREITPAIRERVLSVLDKIEFGS